MELVNCFPRIQSLRDLGIISPRQLPVESFLHDAWFFGCLGDFWLTLHAVVPLPFFLSLPLSPPPHNPLYQNVSSLDEVIDKVCDGLNQLEADPERLRSMTYFPHFRSVS